MHKLSLRKCPKKNRSLLDNLNILYNELIHEQNRSPHYTTLASKANLRFVNDKIIELDRLKMESSIFRSRCQYAAQGEKMSKYYFNLEKRNYVNKSCFCIIKNNGEICTEQKEILREQVRFYRNLYTSDQNIRFQLENTSNIRLNAIQKMELDVPISKEEILTACKDMKTGTVCGCDGLGVEFYLIFWNCLEHLLWGMYQEVINSGQLGRSSRRGIVTLIPKRNRDPRRMESLRPLTLLNCDDKFLAKAMATRIKKVLPDIVGEEQTGFMESRQISTNIRRAIDIVAHIYQSGKKAVIVSIDFEKCFDRIEHDSIYAAMNYFNFGPHFIKLTKIFFTNFYLFTQNNGYCSELFRKERGVNQGCNYSPFCYNVCGAIMSLLIKNNPDIRGIKMGYGVTHVITQFADDTGLFLMYTESCIAATLETLTCIEPIQGSRFLMKRPPSIE